MKFVTSKCSDFGHPEFSVDVSKEASEIVKLFLEYLESAVSSGATFQSGENIVFGWSVFLIKQNSDGTIGFMEPDFVSMPIRWVPGMTVSMHHMVIQGAICETLGCPQEQSNSCMAATVSGSFQFLEDFRLVRAPPAASDSGWKFGSVSQDRDTTMKSLYEISLSRPEIIPFMGLPPGSVIEFRKGVLSIVFQDHSLMSTDSVLLSNLLKSAYFGDNRP